MLDKIEMNEKLKAVVMEALKFDASGDFGIDGDYLLVNTENGMERIKKLMSDPNAAAQEIAQALEARETARAEAAVANRDTELASFVVQIAEKLGVDVPSTLLPKIKR